MSKTVYLIDSSAPRRALLARCLATLGIRIVGFADARSLFETLGRLPEGGLPTLIVSETLPPDLVESRLAAEWAKISPEPLAFTFFRMPRIQEGQEKSLEGDARRLVDLVKYRLKSLSLERKMRIIREKENFTRSDLLSQVYDSGDGT